MPHPDPGTPLGPKLAMSWFLKSGPRIPGHVSFRGLRRVYLSTSIQIDPVARRLHWNPRRWVPTHPPGTRASTPTRPPTSSVRSTRCAPLTRYFSLNKHGFFLYTSFVWHLPSAISPHHPCAHSQADRDSASSPQLPPAPPTLCPISNLCL